MFIAVSCCMLSECVLFAPLDILYDIGGHWVFFVMHPFARLCERNKPAWRQFKRRESRNRAFDAQVCDSFRSLLLYYYVAVRPIDVTLYLLLSRTNHSGWTSNEWAIGTSTYNSNENCFVWVRRRRSNWTNGWKVAMVKNGRNTQIYCVSRF